MWRTVTIEEPLRNQAHSDGSGLPSRTSHPAAPQKLLRNTVKWAVMRNWMGLTRPPRSSDPRSITHAGASPIHGGPPCNTQDSKGCATNTLLVDPQPSPWGLVSTSREPSLIHDGILHGLQFPRHVPSMVPGIFSRLTRRCDSRRCPPEEVNVIGVCLVRKDVWVEFLCLVHPHECLEYCTGAGL